LTAGAKWIHDGVALYYSHASIQLGWILDAEAHQTTWRNRNADHRLGASHLVRLAWENMLRDEGVQYSFISYVDVIQKGVPEDFKVLILPAVLCLSDVEARRIKDFCSRGGTVIADYLPGLFDQHGRGRKKGGVLDDLFGVHHDPAMKAKDLFQPLLWTEVDQEKHYRYESFPDFLGGDNACIKHESGFHKAVRSMSVENIHPLGKGRAVLMNLSPQRYNAFRSLGYEEAKRRDVFMKHLKSAGIERWVKLEGAKKKTIGYEITYWEKGDRTLLFVCQNPAFQGSSLGGGRTRGLKTHCLDVNLSFALPLEDSRNERTGEKLPRGKVFTLPWKMNEALVLSFNGPPPGR
jgi:hypothetical protein